MDKLKMHSPDLSQENIAKLRELFPGCVTEAHGETTGKLRLAVDFDQLRQELSNHIVEGPQERYRLDWPGKREALALANTPITKTLRPCREESVDFGAAKNLFIEGDNLEALKLIQDVYLGQIKMIYIDPPYNTGNEFIYRDSFASVQTTQEVVSGERTEKGLRLVANKETNGRFHSDWLNMMLPRLRLCRHLLREDGLLFISMGDTEIGTLRSICDEVFGTSKFEGHIHWRRRHNQPNDPTKMIGVVAEHILSYSRDKAALKESGVGKVALTGSFSNPDNDPRGAWASKPWRVGSNQNGSKYTITTLSGEQIKGEWMGERATYEALLKDNRIYFPDGGRGAPRKKYFESEREEEGQCATNWWPHDQFGHNQEGNSVLTEIFSGEKNVFSNPKPPRLIKNLMDIANCKDGDIVLDFFLGSASSYHACRQYPFRVRFIGAQIPEPLSNDITDHQPAIKICNSLGLPLNMASISSERMRRVDKLTGLANNSRGFRVLKVDTSNMKDIYYRPDDLKQSDLLNMADNVKEDRTAEDLLFQVLVDWGVDLTLPIRRETVWNKTVFFVDDNALVACFERDVTEELVKELASHKPLRVVFRDNGFVSDAVKINVEQIFRQLSPTTEVKTL